MALSSWVAAHELNPGYLQLREVQPRTFEVMWKVPRRGAMRLDMRPTFPEICQATSSVPITPRDDQRFDTPGAQAYIYAPFTGVNE